MSSPNRELYMLESACMKIMWQREFQLQEVKVLRFEVLGGNSPINSIAVFEAVRRRYLSTKQST
jgi:hypothetical protein